MKLLKKLVVFVLVLSVLGASDVQAMGPFGWAWGLGSGLASAGSSLLTAVSSAGDATVAATAAADSTSKATLALAHLLSPVMCGKPENLLAPVREGAEAVDPADNLVALQTVSGREEDGGMGVSRLAYEMNAVAGAQMAKLDAMVKPVLANVATHVAQAKKPGDAGLMTLQDLTSDAAHAEVPVSSLFVTADAVANKHLNRVDRISEKRVRDVAKIIDPLSSTVARLATTADKLVTDLHDPLDRLEETLRNTYEITAPAKKADGTPMMLSDRTGKRKDKRVPVSVLAANLDGIMKSQLANIHQVTAQAKKANGRPMMLSDCTGKKKDKRVPVSVLAANFDGIMKSQPVLKSLTTTLDNVNAATVSLKAQIEGAKKEAKKRWDQARTYVETNALKGAGIVAGVVVVYVTYKYFAKRSAIKAAKAAQIPTLCSFVKRGSSNKAAIANAQRMLGKEGVANVVRAQKYLSKARRGLYIMVNEASREQAMIKLLSKQTNVAWISAGVIAQSYKDCFAAEKLIIALRWFADQKVPLVVVGADSLVQDEDAMNWFTLAAENNQVIMNCHKAASEQLDVVDQCVDVQVTAQA